MCDLSAVRSPSLGWRVLCALIALRTYSPDVTTALASSERGAPG